MRKFLFCIWFAVFNFVFVFSNQTNPPLVKIKNGSVKGSVHALPKGDKYFSFSGIPYAKPPIGNRRFAAPVPNDPWKGILDATQRKQRCAQIYKGYSISRNDSLIAGSEDCLYINVYTPRLNASRPVIVYIPSEESRLGSTDYRKFSEKTYIEQDVVVVFINYRVGVLGSLSTGDLVAPGNWRLKDQFLALKWVKKNIKQFGGDPKKVTLVGQGFGGASISYLLQSNKTRGYYRSAILQSSSSLCEWALAPNPQGITRGVALILGIQSNDSKTIIKELRKVDYKVLNVAAMNFATIQTNPPLVKIKNGSVKGSVHALPKGDKYFSFSGIPYAKPPIGNRRFAAPVPNDPWKGILDATQRKQRCAQIYKGYSISRNDSLIAGSEDCLYINVYTPRLNASRPVIVYIPSEESRLGSTDYRKFSEKNYIEQDVVVVFINYRVGVLGSLSTGDLVAAGNWRLKDQFLALKWVKKNIKQFGGDPKKVTLVGQGFGGASISYLLQSNKTRGYYRSAILQSSSSLCEWALAPNPQGITRGVALILGIQSNDSKTIIKELRKVDYKVLNVAAMNFAAIWYIEHNAFHKYPFGVVKEPKHKGAMFTERSYQLLSQGHFNKVPIIIGYNSREVDFTLGHINVLKYYFKKYVRTGDLAPGGLSPSIHQRKKAQRLIKEKYFKNGISAADRNQIGKFLSVDAFVRPIIKTAILMSKHTKVYFYVFSYKGKLGDPTNAHKGVVHGEELPYLYYVDDYPNKSDRLTRKRLLTLWTNFAKTLDPTSSDDRKVLNNIKWTPNNVTTISEQLNYLDFNVTLQMKTNPDDDDWQFYKGIFYRYGDRNNRNTY